MSKKCDKCKSPLVSSKTVGLSGRDLCLKCFELSLEDVSKHIKKLNDFWIPQDKVAK